jgi:hypothetical protein
MGTWSHGNFDDDTSADHLSELTGKLVKEIRDAMRNPDEIQPDEYWGCAVPCNIEILTLISAQKWVGTILPTHDEATQWKSTFMQVWDACIDDLDPKPEYKIQRRAVLEKTFNDLLMHIRQQSKS